MHGGCVGPKMHTQTKGSLLYTVFLNTNALPQASKRGLPVLTRMLYMEEKKRAKKEGGKKKKKKISSTFTFGNACCSHNSALAELPLNRGIQNV